MARAPTWSSDEDGDRPAQRPGLRTVSQHQHSPARPLAVAVLAVVAAAAIALSLSSASSSALSPSSSSRPSWRRGGGALAFSSVARKGPQGLLLSTVNDPYYQARLRPLALSLGGAHPIAARRPPHALFADVRLFDENDDDDGDKNAARLAALLAASDGGDAKGVPTDSKSYELFVGVTDEWIEDVEEEVEEADGTRRKETKKIKRTRARQQRLSCLHAAKRLYPEPFHASMLVRNRTVPTSWATEPPSSSDDDDNGDEEGPWRQPQHPHPTKLSPSLWRWDAGVITRTAFDAVPRFLGGKDCGLCTDVLRYKLWGGRLYRRTSDCRADPYNSSAPPRPPGSTSCPADWPRGAALEEILLAAVWFYSLPDSDLAVHRGDGAAKGFPVLQHNIPRDHPLGGFSIPYPEHWFDVPASARQSLAWAACTRARYGALASSARRREKTTRRRGESEGGGARAAPAAPAPATVAPTPAAAAASAAPPGASCALSPLIPRAVWRGTTTDPYHGAWLDQLLGMTRARLHVLSLVHSDVLDARIAAVRQMDDPQNAQMMADKKADERLLSVPSSFAGSDGKPLAWGAGGEAAAGRAAAARLAQCPLGGDEEGEEGDDKGEGGGDDNDAPHPPVYIPMEDYSRYTAVLDVDGNGWSSRLYALLSGAATRPVLKQSTPLAAGYEHLFAPGRHLAHFRGDLRDVADVARRWTRLVGDESGAAAAPSKEEEEEDSGDDAGAFPSSPRDADAMATRASTLAALALNRWALIESAAASMEAYAERTDWAPDPPRAEDGWDMVPFSSCCKHGGGLPSEVVAAMKAGGD